MRLAQASITHGLSLLFALVSLVVLSGMGAYLYASLEELFAQRDAAELIGKAALVRHILAEVPSGSDLMQAKDPLEHVVVGHPALRLSVFDEDSTPLLALPAQPPLVLDPPRAIPADAALAPNQVVTTGPMRMLAAWSRIADGRDAPVQIVLTLDRADQLRLLAYYRRNLIFGILVGALLAAGMGLLIARRGLKPLRHMALSASRISAAHLSDRLELERVPQELRQLASAFNVMLARLEDSFGRLAGFSSNLAHELRTPINNLMGQTQVTLSRVRSPEEYREVLESNLEEYERLSRIVSDMLFLAKADHAQIGLRKVPVDLREEFERVAAFYEAHAEERGVTVDCQGSAVIGADRQLVQRALSNILSNAIRHTPKGGQVSASICEQAGYTVTAIGNPGPGIEPEHLERIFDRFYRVPRLDEVERGGTGLGLAIVKSILELHGGWITADSVPGEVTTLRLFFPTADDPQPAKRPPTHEKKA